MPPISLAERPDIGFEAIKTLFKENLGSADYNQFNTLLTYLDVENFQKVLSGERVSHFGKFNQKDLDQLFVKMDGIPSFFTEFIEKFKDPDSALKNFQQLFTSFFDFACASTSKFLQFYFRTEREIRILLAVYRAKQLNVDPLVSLQFEDDKGTFMAEVIALKDAPVFDFPLKYQKLGEKLAKNPSDPLMQFKIMNEYRYGNTIKFLEEEPFSIDSLMAYVQAYLIVENIFSLDEKIGGKNLNKMVTNRL